ncbi:Enhancer of mRNA-decapping protein 4-like protein, partial [Frankliniella fusca]
MAFCDMRKLLMRLALRRTGSGVSSASVADIAMRSARSATNAVSSSSQFPTAEPDAPLETSMTSAVFIPATNCGRVGSVLSPQDWRIKQKVFHRILNWLVGLPHKGVCDEHLQE